MSSASISYFDICTSVNTGKVLKFSNIHLILEGAAGKPEKLLQVHKHLQKTRMFSLMFFLPKSDSHFLKLIFFLGKKNKQNLGFKILAIKELIRHVIF